MLEKSEYVDLIADALRRNETIVISCYCTVRYSGRAESFLDYGDRLVVMKSDNALIIHQPTGNAPVNYMKPDTDISATIQKGNLVLYGKNIHKKEHMWVTAERVHFFNAHRLEDGQSIILQGTERHMSDMIYKNPGLIEKGFMPVSREEQTTYGFIDVFGRDKDGVLTIVECKRYSADLGAVTQLRRYVERVKETKGIDKVRGIIAAPKITSNALKMLQDWGFTFVVVHPPNYLERYDQDQTSLNAF
jgi:RecB family endonuclease NucS